MMTDEHQESVTLLAASGWVKVGSYEDRELLERSIEKIQRKWSDRYNFKIVAARVPRDSYHLYLRHR